MYEIEIVHFFCNIQPDEFFDTIALRLNMQLVSMFIEIFSINLDIEQKNEHFSNKRQKKVL